MSEDDAAYLPTTVPLGPQRRSSQELSISKLGRVPLSDVSNFTLPPIPPTESPGNFLKLNLSNASICLNKEPISFRA